MSRLERLAESIGEERWELLTDLVFAIVWVTLVTALFDVLDGPQWAYYGFMLLGIPVYYVMFTTTEAMADAEE